MHVLLRGAFGDVEQKTCCCQCQSLAFTLPAWVQLLHL